MAINLKTLVLSPNMMPESVFPLSTITAEEAIVKVLTEKFEVLHYYDRPVLTPSRYDLRWPSVVVSPYMPNYNRKLQMKKHFLFLREHGRCIFCSRELSENEVTKEHLIPTSKGGKNNWENVGASCLDCNSAKGDALPVGKWKPRIQPYEPNYFQLMELRKKFPVVIYDECWGDFLPGWSGEVILRQQKFEIANDQLAAANTA